MPTATPSPSRTASRVPVAGGVHYDDDKPALSDSGVIVTATVVPGVLGAMVVLGAVLYAVAKTKAAARAAAQGTAAGSSV